MSSSNRVLIAVAEEDTYGEFPASPTFYTMRKKSESFTGTPTTIQSSEIRSDRQQGGQVNTGLEVTGNSSFELAPDALTNILIGHALMSGIVPASVHSAALTISGNTLSTDGSFTGDIADGDIVILSGMSDDENNTVIKALSVSSGSLTFVGEGLIDGSGAVATARVPSYHTVGTLERSVVISKEFLDIDDGNVRSIAYSGMRVGEMSFDFPFGQIVTGDFAFAGNGYSLPTDPVTAGETLVSATTTDALNAASGFGWLLVNDVDLDICVENITLSVNNNLAPVNCVGRAAPKNQKAGSASVNFSATVHLGLTSFDLFMAAKTAQTAMSISFFAVDENGLGYAIDLGKIQVSFPDPAASAGNENITLALTGVASYSSAISNTLRFYIF
ncbi:MAG: hypothetical protein GY774_04720 [Planctomycetes bacterium]|nr:hypothetical protein [Planctomycetota bacterium]